VNVASFVLCGCPIVAKTAIPTSGAAKIVDIAIRFWDCLALGRNQKLFPHFSEARTAVFTVEEVQYGGHDRTPSLILTINFQTINVFSAAIRNLHHSPSLFQADFAIHGKWLRQSQQAKAVMLFHLAGFASGSSDERRFRPLPAHCVQGGG
jgi:hypothetical protein